MSDVRSVLHVFLPCRKIYPVGLTYLANAIHRHHPEIGQRIIDLTLIPKPHRKTALRNLLNERRPDLVLFSWRDIQVFAPHEGEPSLKYAFNFYYSRNPFKRLTASFRGLHYLYRYYAGISEALSYPWLVHRECPQTRLMIGGGAFSSFAEPLIPKLPPGIIGIMGEGEEAALKVIEGKELSDERFIVRKNGSLLKGRPKESVFLEQFTVDLPYIGSIFPQSGSYHGDHIGLQTKRGCPYDCQFCEYPYLEGKRVRYRRPADVAADLKAHYDLWGTRRFWFTDAQFITGGEAYPQCIEILERILRSRMKIEWSGYIRTSLITPELARLMVATGVGDLEVSITSGSQKVLNELHMGFRLDSLYDGCRYLKEAGFAGKVILNYSPNSPGETEETLLESVESYKKVAAILGEDRVHPMLFFLGIQPNTGLEQRLIEEGYLSEGYNPLTLNPFSIKKMIYNPKPLNRLLARACLSAWDRVAWKQASETGGSVAQIYADESLFRGVAERSGREILFNLEAEIRSKR
jgi:radical SAM superfamily enzyme YgiQ (UPF0313 family)